jgi:hypothetical protein
MTKGEELTKRCAKCETVKAVSHFSRNSSRGDGFQSRCKACQAADHAARPKRSFTKLARAEAKARGEARRNAPKPDLAARQREWKAKNPERLAALRKKAYAGKYGLTPEQLDGMFAEQNGQCAICKIDIEFANNGLHVDHDHFNGSARALLCGPCNLGLGFFQDSPAILAKAATYLSFWQIIHEDEAAQAEST